MRWECSMCSGLEFVELKDAAHGFHGNAIFSRWPILWAEVLAPPAGAV